MAVLQISVSISIFEQLTGSVLVLQITLPVSFFLTYCISFSFTFIVLGSHDYSLYSVLKSD